jgi:hypothetical protein
MTHLLTELSCLWYFEASNKTAPSPIEPDVNSFLMTRNLCLEREFRAATMRERHMTC